MSITETEEADGMVKFSVTIPPAGAAKLRKIQELSGLKSLEDTIRFLLALYAKRAEMEGYPFGEETSAPAERPT